MDIEICIICNLLGILKKKTVNEISLNTNLKVALEFLVGN